MSNPDLTVRSRQVTDQPLLPTPAEDPGLATTVVEGSAGIAAEVATEAIANALSARGFAGAWGEIGGALGWAVTIGEAWMAMLSAPSDGRIAGLLRAAFGDVPTSNNYEDLRKVQTALAVGAVLSGASDEEIAQLEQRWGGSAFRRGLEMARQMQAEHPDDFARAQEIYRGIRREWQDGVAAALEGWYDESRGPVFKQAYAQVTTLLRAGDAATHAARRTAQESKEQGFLDAASGRVDSERAERDASYRSGVSHAERTRRRGGAEALSQEASRIELRRQSREASARVPVQG